MEISTQQAGEVTVAQIHADRMDAGNYGEFKSAIKPVVDKKRSVVLDISDLQFVDSSGLGAILSCLRQLNSRGGDLKIAGMTKPVRTLFELVRMNKIIEVYTDSVSAVSAFTQPV